MEFGCVADVMTNYHSEYGFVSIVTLEVTTYQEVVAPLFQEVYVRYFQELDLVLRF